MTSTATPLMDLSDSKAWTYVFAAMAEGAYVRLGDDRHQFVLGVPPLGESALVVTGEPYARAVNPAFRPRADQSDPIRYDQTVRMLGVLVVGNPDGRVLAYDVTTADEAIDLLP